MRLIIVFYYICEKKLYRATDREDKRFYLIVGSVSGRTGGFYICHTEEEIEDTIDNIKHRANQMLRMCHVLNWKKEQVINE